MRFRRSFLITSILTAALFVASYLLSPSSEGKFFPLNIQLEYASAMGSKEPSSKTTQKIPAVDISELRITTTAADIELYSTSEAEFSVDYEGPAPRAGEPVRTKIEEGKLHIDVPEGASSKTSFLTLSINTISKKLKVGIPQTVKAVAVSTTSGDLDGTLSKLGKLTFQSASGDMELEKAEIENAKTQTASGDVELSGSVKTFSGDTASGSVRLELTNNEPNIEIDSASGDVEIRLPETASVTVKAGSSSGDVRIRNEEIGNKVIGTGVGRINLDSASGDLKVQ